MLVGSTLDARYRIVREIGKGGMGVVCEAVNVATDRKVALKAILNEEIAKNPQAVERFQREARAAGRIDTQHVAQVLDAGLDGPTGMLYIVMEMLAGEDLSHLVRRLGPLAPELALRIVAQACVGLAKAHEVGVVHRDLKPANLFLARRDRGEVVVKLLDFGVAKLKMDAGLGAEGGPHELTRTGSLLGSPLYMSPEQAKGLRTIDHRADLWSLGVTLYKVLAGRTPFEHAETLGQLILAVCTQAPPPIQDVAPWVPPEVAALLDAALQADVDARLQSATAMLEALTRMLPGGDSLHVDMLRPAGAELRATVAPRFVPARALAQAHTVAIPAASVAATVMLEGPSSAPFAPSSSGVSTASGPPSAHGSTTAGARSVPSYATSLSGASNEPASRRTSKLPFVGLGLALAAGGVAAAWVAFGRPAGSNGGEQAAKAGAAQMAQTADVSRPSPSAGGPPGATASSPAVQASSSAAAAPPASAGGDPVSRLTELRRRFEAGKMSRSAYQTERQKILDGM
jgi:serine/threonine protein kinase